MEEQTIRDQVKKAHVLMYYYCAVKQTCGLDVLKINWFKNGFTEMNGTT